MRTDIEERQRLLSTLCKEHPLYSIMQSSLLERQEKYEIMRRAEKPKREYTEGR